ncbi:MAG: PilN domain-containing protein [Pseudanabaenaceae cyanobacterium SKYGB_i_bin29]|nr:PilN domain-containing protein [Pseudanabaenaceae cyanobacterium SKYG29]MDW8421960.1 PilN domain-containing protein [Pseudanabaenaceae cyanobacterium SKYGB_i_bin29]
MYTIDINFLKDRQVAEGAGEAAPIADVNWLIGGGAVAVILIASTGIYYFFLSRQRENLQQQVATLTRKEEELDKQIADLKAKEAEIAAIDQQTQQLVALFVGDIPASAILQDLRERTPVNVKIENFQQLDRKITIEGEVAANSPKDSAFDQVNDFMLKLQESPFVAANGVELKSAKLSPPKKDVEVDIAKYRIELTLTPRTTLELEGALQKVRSDGALARIATLRQKGISVSSQQEGEAKQ